MAASVIDQVGRQADWVVMAIAIQLASISSTLIEKYCRFQSGAAIHLVARYRVGCVPQAEFDGGVAVGSVDDEQGFFRIGVKASDLVVVAVEHTCDLVGGCVANSNPDGFGRSASQERQLAEV